MVKSHKSHSFSCLNTNACLKMGPDEEGSIQAMSINPHLLGASNFVNGDALSLGGFVAPSAIAFPGGGFLNGNARQGADNGKPKSSRRVTQSPQPTSKKSKLSTKDQSVARPSRNVRSIWRTPWANRR